MEIVTTLIVGVAGSIIADVIKDLIIGRKKVARKFEIERQVVDQLRNSFDIQHRRQFEFLKKQVMDEIELLSTRDPDLVVFSNHITLCKPSLDPPPSVHQEELLEKELLERLNNLHAIIARRREELGLPTNQDIDLFRGVQASQPKIEWKQKAGLEEQPDWQKEIDALDDRIRRRRLGELIEDV